MTDNTFGVIDFDFDYWEGTANITFGGKDPDALLYVFVKEDKVIDPVQYSSYANFLSRWNLIETDLWSKLLAYYQIERDTLGFSQHDNPCYPEVNTVNELMEMIELTAVIVPTKEVCNDVYNGRVIYLAFDCSWDEENGIGVRIVNEEIDDLGHQDYVF